MFAQGSADAKPSESKLDSDRLPPGYSPPPERLAIMDLDRPLLDKDEMAKLKKEAVNHFAKVKSSCDLSPSGLKTIEGSVRFKLAELTLKDKQSDLPKLHERFVADVLNLGDQTKKAIELQETAKAIGKEIVKVAPDVLANNFYARLHMVGILGEIDYSPASEVLINVLVSKDITEDEVNGQPEAVKIAAVNSLVRILRFASPVVKERSAIANAVISELQKPNVFWWRQLRMIEVLRYCDIPGTDVNDRPFVVEALLSVAKDESRPWKVRTRACYALGRVPLPKQIRVDDVITCICECALQLSNDAAANPKDLSWKKCFANIYFAFQQGGKEKEKDLDTENRSPGGLLNRPSTKTVAQPAYQTLLPIFNDVRISSEEAYIAKPPSAENVRKLTEFVRSRNPNAGAQAKK